MVDIERIYRSIEYDKNVIAMCITKAKKELNSLEQLNELCNKNKDFRNNLEKLWSYADIEEPLEELFKKYGLDNMTQKYASDIIYNIRWYYNREYGRDSIVYTLKVCKYLYDNLPDNLSEGKKWAYERIEIIKKNRDFYGILTKKINEKFNHICKLEDELVELSQIFDYLDEKIKN